MALFANPYEPELDPFFQAAGLPSRPLAFQGRTYEGVFDGRKVRVDVSPRKVTRYAGEIRYSRYQGHRFDFTLGVKADTRFVAAQIAAANRLSRWINRRYGLTHLESLPPELAHLEIWALEPDWARAWLRAPKVAESLVRLLPADPGARLRSVSLRPVGGLGFALKSPIQSVRRSHLAGWMNELYILAQGADSVPPPQHRAQPGRLEMLVEKHPFGVAFAILGGLMAATVVVTVALLAVLFLLMRACGRV